MEPDGNWKTKALLLGGLIGALTGVGAAYLFIRQAEISGQQPKLGTGEGIKLGLGVLGLLRRIGELGEGSG